MSRRWRYLEADWEWYLAPPEVDRQELPELDEPDQPVAGRILGPHGETIKVVRHGPDRPPFGFTSSKHECSGGKP